MKRYFMATAEAVLLVLEAASIGDGGETFVLDMGEPIKIEDLAKEMIRLSGYEPGVEIPIVYTGLRPGEKLFEEFIGDSEDLEKLKFEKIFKLKKTQVWDEPALFGFVERLKNVSESRDPNGDIVEIFQQLVPTYTPNRGDGNALRW
jgi:FlaA1/EpsC-like NDP-sugar epimerase